MSKSHEEQVSKQCYSKIFASVSAYRFLLLCWLLLWWILDYKMINLFLHQLVFGCGVYYSNGKQIMAPGSKILVKMKVTELYMLKSRVHSYWRKLAHLIQTHSRRVPSQPTSVEQEVAPVPGFQEMMSKSKSVTNNYITNMPPAYINICLSMYSLLGAVLSEITF